MKLETTNDKKQYVQPKIRVCMIDACDIIATSGSQDPDDDGNPYVIYPNFRG